MNLLDPLTLALILTVVSLWQMLAIGLLYRLAPSYPGVRLWMLATAFEAASTGLIALRGVAPPLVTVIFANALGLIGIAVLVEGIGRFLGRPIRGWPIISGVMIGAVVLAHLAFTYLLVSIGARVFLLLLCAAILHGCGVALLLRAAPPHLRWAARFSAASLACDGVWSLVRAAALFVGAQLTGMASPVNSIAPVVILVTDLLTTAGLAGLIIQSLLYDLRQAQARERMTLATAAAELKVANAALEQRLSMNRLLVDHLPDTALMLFDANLRYTLAAGPALEGGSFAPQMIEGRAITEVLPPDRAAALLPSYRAALAGRPQEMEYERAGRFYHVQILPVPDAISQGVSGMVVARDVTLIKRAEASLTAAKEAAESADRAKSTFLAHMSHEIRTPLNAVIGTADLLRDTALDSEQQAYVATIQTGGEALLAIVNTILDLAKIEAGQFTLDRESIDLPVLLNSARALVAPSADAKGIALRLHVDPQLPSFVQGDAARLRQILINLLANAIKFTSVGEVALHAAALPLGDGRHELAVSVRDSGIGIAPEHVTQIFQPFAQAAATTARHYGGTGLGLTISRHLAELMGGQIEVSSQLEVGSTFTLRLPVVASSPPPAARQCPATALAPNMRLLIVEDNPVNQWVTRKLLIRLGQDAEVVADGAAAVAAVAQRDYDLVLMDIQMPGMDGDEASRAIRALGSAVRQPMIVALTANVLATDQERYRQAGMDDCLTKPVSLAALTDLLARVPARRGASSFPNAKES
jgi:signal transduction histidine kinase/CheY-like chemotaxis protein